MTSFPRPSKASDTRERVLQSLIMEPSQTIDEVAADIGATRNTARTALLWLYARQIVQRRAHARGAGSPTFAWWVPV